MKETKASGNGIFYIGLVLSIVRYMIPETTLVIPDLLQIIKGLMFLFLTLQLLYAFPKYEFKEKQIILSVFFFVILIGISTKRFGTVYSMFALIVGAKGVDFKKCLKVYYITGAILCLSVVLLSYFGIIENKGFVSEGHGISESSTIRYCMGYIWPTDFATHVFFVLFAFWLAKDGRMTILRFLTFSVVTYFVYRVSDSMLGCGCIVLLILFSFVLKTRETLVINHPKLFGYSKFKKILWMSYIPFMFLIMAYATDSYDSTDPNWIVADVTLSGRLHISQEALEKEGYTWLGQEYELIGGDAVKSLYNFIDSSFLQSLIIYGIAFSILLLLSYMCITGHAYKRRDYAFLYAILVAGVSGAIAQHFLQVFMNPLLLAVTAQLVSDESLINDNTITPNEISNTKMYNLR